MKKKIIPVILLVIAVVAVVELKNYKKKAEPEGCPAGQCFLPIPGNRLIPEELQQSVTNVPTAENPLPTLLDLGAGKCIPCKTMAPILDEMKETFAGRLNVIFIDVWENEGANEKYGIRMIPTQIFFDAAGNELFRHEGFYSREEMLTKWAELGYELEGESKELPKVEGAR